MDFRLNSDTAEQLFTATSLLAIMLLPFGLAWGDRLNAARPQSVVIEVGIVESFGDFVICRGCQGLGREHVR